MNDIRWKIKKQDGKIYGPADTQTIEKWIGEQRLMPEDLVSTADSEDWKPVKDYPQFAGMFSGENTTIEQNIPKDKNKVKSCVNHPDKVAFGFCLKCGRYFCQNCIKTTFLEKDTFYICRECGGRCELLQSSEPAGVAASPSFWRSILSSFIYPFRGHGIILLISGAIGLTVAEIVIPFTLFFAPVLIIMLYGYIATYMFSIIQYSAGGEPELPDFPGLTNIVDGTIVPFLQVAGTFIISFTIFLPVCIIYFPMALIAVARFGSIKAVDPRLILPSIIRAPKQYFVALLFFYLTVFISSQSQTIIHQKIGSLLHNLAYPFGGLMFLMVKVLLEFIFLYFIMVEMNILGTFYFTQKEKLRWFRSDNP